MEVPLNSAYIEVSKILNILGDSYKNKIPKKVLNLFEDIDLQSDIAQNSEKLEIENLKISRSALIIISILNIKYWENNLEKKEELKKIYDENENKYQEKINAYKTDDWLSKRNIKTTSNLQKYEERSLVVKKEKNFIEKILDFIKNIFHK